MRYQYREDESEPIGRFKDMIYIEVHPGDGRMTYYREGNLSSANKTHGRERRVVGASAIVIVYPHKSVPDFVLTVSVAIQVAVAFMTGKRNINNVEFRE